MSDWPKIIIAIILIAIGLFGSLYVMLWVCIVGGVAQILDGIQADPSNNMGVGIGFARIFCATFVWVFAKAFFFAPADRLIDDI